MKEAFYVHPAISTKKRLEMDTAVKETEREVDGQKSWKEKWLCLSSSEFDTTGPKWLDSVALSRLCIFYFCVSVSVYLCFCKSVFVCICICVILTPPVPSG